ncbi:MAG: hypothetical protein HY290_10915 [Planctomycetia bacterium]|nr:hypothetical protein [Planctomycetia bacterium]
MKLEAEEDGVPSASEFVETISLVGTATENDQRCRWVEIKSVAFDAKNNPVRTHVTKLLIPESEMLKSKDPLKNAVRGWVRVNDQPPSPMKPIAWDPGLFVGECLSWLPGVRIQLREVDQPRDVAYQRGTIQAAKAFSGTREYTKADRQELGEVRWKSRFTLWHHADLTCGFAHAVIEAEKWIGNERDGKVVITYFLEDGGKDGKSGLPDNN